MSSERVKNREDYMKALKHELRKLPKEDFDAALAYFEEYFQEAGQENEQQAMEDLGTPRQAASELIVSLAVKNSQEPVKSDVKRGFSSVWVGILAVFAAPIALPLALAFVIVIAALGLCVVCLLLALVLTGVAVFASGIASIVVGCLYLFRAPADAMANLGIGILGLGISMIVLPAGYELCKKALGGIAGAFGRLVKKFAKGGDRYEEK